MGQKWGCLLMQYDAVLFVLMVTICWAPIYLQIEVSITALGTGGAVYLWGSNTYGQLGDGTIISSSLPRRVLLQKAVSVLALGGFHSAALSTGLPSLFTLSLFSMLTSEEPHLWELVLLYSCHFPLVDIINAATSE